MDLGTFTEKEIRRAILSKINPLKINKGGKHWKGYIYLHGKLITKVKIPNEHIRPFRPNKAAFLARDLKLTNIEYNQLVECTLKGPEYYQKLHKFL